MSGAQRARDGARKRSYQKHGLRALEAALDRVGDREGWIEELGPVGDALLCWREALIADLGGEDAVSTQQRALVDLSCRTYLLLEHVDRWLLRNPIINKRSRKLHPVVLQRQRMADSLAKYLQALGLEKRQPKGADLTDYVRERYGSDPG